MQESHTPLQPDSYLIRLGYHDRANFMPLVEPLKAGWVMPESPWKLELVSATQRELLDGILHAKVDAAFVSPVSITQHSAHLTPLRGWGLAAEGAIETAVLVAPQRLDLMDRADLVISTDAYKSTAEYLLKALLAPYYGITLTMRAPGDPNNSSKGARLLYGDEAARAAQSSAGGVAEDLGKAWFVMSGLPMVWEVLAVSRDLETRKPGASEALHALLTRSQRAAQEQQTTVLEEAAARLELKKERVKELFARQRYTLGEREQRGLAHFLDLAARASVIG